MSDDKVKPESPGLWLGKSGGGTYTSKELVENAEKHLLQLLTNPYYHEAYQRLRRKQETLLTPLSSLPINKGALASRTQWPKNRQKGPGRPKKTLPLCELFLALMPTHPEKTLADQCREWVALYPDVVRGMWPNIRQEEKLAKNLAKKLRNYRRNR